MIINGKKLLAAKPVDPMLETKERHGGVTCGLSEAGYDIRIREKIEFIPRVDNFSGVTTVTTFVDGVADYGRFALASSLETFHMPNDLLGIVHDKSSWARRGLSVFNTCIEPGWSGTLTLELVYHGSEPLTIEAGSGIAQILFHQLAEPAAYAGRYQNQPPRPVAYIPV